ncbi:MAG: diaminopimelate decarboxylase [Anaerolineae bacterium]|nr:diaminopimelate decarboxylase [Anaerolineae bacterium]
MIGDLFPITAHVDPEGYLWLGGCRADVLAREFGTPLYVFDEATLRERCRRYKAALAAHYPGPSQVAYASKAYLCLALVRLLAEEGLGLDVVSGGELYLARQAGFPLAAVHFHGNNKSAAELEMALDWGVGRIVVDNAHELALLERLAGERARPERSRRGRRLAIWLRLSPDIDLHTHTYNKTGLADSKFGFPLAEGLAEQALQAALASPHLELVGLHTHLGSQAFETEPFTAAVEALLAFAGEMGRKHGFRLQELSPGGGWGVPYHQDDPPAQIEEYVRAVSLATVEGCVRHGLPLPRLILEPGRSIVGPAGIALYTVGVRKTIPGVRTYVSVDGGMADNIRPALYGVRYTALAATKAHQPVEEVVTVVGKYCESGDWLIRDIRLPKLEPGDLLAMPVAGAYHLPMASNYNLALRPAVVWVKDGRARLVQRRESYEDLVARDAMSPLLEQTYTFGSI